MKRERDRDEFIRKRAARQRKIRNRRIKILFSFLIIFLLSIAVILSLTVFFPVENITAEGSAVYKSEDIISASGIKKGDNLFTLSKTEVLNSLKAKLPYIESVEFERSLPSSINIVVKDADEYACFFKDGKYYTVSKSGWVLESGDEAEGGIFEIRGAAVECKVGTQLIYEDEQQQILLQRITDALKTNKISIDYVDLTDSLNLTMGVEGRFTVIIGSSNNIEEKIKHLGGMIEKISPEKQGKIDLSMWTVDNTSATFVAKNDK